MKKQAIYLLLFVIGYGGLFVGSNKGIRRTFWIKCWKKDKECKGLLGSMLC